MGNVKRKIGLFGSVAFGSRALLILSPTDRMVEHEDDFLAALRREEHRRGPVLLREQAESIAAHARAGRRGKQRGEKGGTDSCIYSRVEGIGRARGRRSDRLHVESLADQHPVFATPVAIAPLLRFEPRSPRTVLPPPPLPHISKISSLRFRRVNLVSVRMDGEKKKEEKKKIDGRRTF